MQAQRDALPPDSVFRPSVMWNGFGGAFEFISDLSDHSLRNIRIHTSFMTGVAWFQNIGNNHFINDDDKLIGGLNTGSPRFLIEAPERCGFGKEQPGLK